MLRRWSAVLALLALFLVPWPAQAKPLPTCKSPRNAVDSVFLWQTGKQQSLANAAKCLERGGRSTQELEETARRLKIVFDAEGAKVDAGKLSDDPDHVDAEHNAQAVVHPRFPEVVVEKRDGRWVWTRESLDWIDDHYEDHLGAFDRVIDAIPAPLRLAFGGVALWQYGALLLLLLVGGLVNRVLRALLGAWFRRGEDPAAGGKPGLGRRFLDRAQGPSVIAVTALVVRLVYPELRLPVGVASGVHLAVRLLLMLAALIAASRFADVFADELALRVSRSESRLDGHLVPIVRKSLHAATYFVGGLLFLHTLGVDVTALFATLGIGTLAVGLAAKDTLANLFGGLSIFVDNPFKLGDWIQVEGVDGVVEEVGFRSTRLRTFHDSLVVLPNAKLADSKIDNFGQRRVHRGSFSLFVVHGTKGETLEALFAALRAVVDGHPHVLADRTDVVLAGIGLPALEIQVVFFFEGAAKVDVAHEKHAILLAVLERVRELGVALHPPAPAGSAAPVAAR